MDDIGTSHMVLNDGGQVQNCYVNELLTYLCYYINNSTLGNIRRNIAIFYTCDEIIEAKKLLWNLSKDNLDQYTERRSTDRRSCSEASLDDIIEAIKKLDGLSKLPNFVARNVVKIPDRQPEELNILYAINRINNLEKKISSVDEALLNNDNFFVKINTELSTHKNLIEVVNNEVEIIKSQLNNDFLKKMLDKKFLSNWLDDIIMTKVSNVLYKKEKEISFIEVKNTAKNLDNHQRAEKSDLSKLESVDDQDNVLAPVSTMTHEVTQVLGDNSNSNVNIDSSVPVSDEEKTPIQCEKIEELVDEILTKHKNNVVQLDRNDEADSITNEDLVIRFNKLRYSDSDNDHIFKNKKSNSCSFDDSFSCDGFQQFLDEFVEKDFNSASLTEFHKNRNNVNQTDTKKLIPYNVVVKKNNSLIQKSPVRNSNINHSKNKFHIKLDNSCNEFINSSPLRIVDDEGFVLKESRNDFKKRLYNQKNKGLLGPPMKLINLWVHRIVKGDEYELQNYLLKKNVEAQDIVRTSHTESKFKSFKISILKNDKDKVLHNSFFPPGIKCRIWKDNKNNAINSRTFTGRLYKDYL